VRIHEALAAADLSARERRIVWNAVVGNAIEGSWLTAESVTWLCEFVTGKISADEHQARVLARYRVSPAPPQQDPSSTS
jgi:hypothetical protein